MITNRQRASARTRPTVFVTGEVYGTGKVLHQNIGTVACNAATGNRLRTARYDGPAHQDDWAAAVAASPISGTVLVAGYSLGTGAKTGYATLPYQG